MLTAGDVLRAITCTNFVYPANALIGVQPPERHIVSICSEINHCLDNNALDA